MIIHSKFKDYKVIIEESIDFLKKFNYDNNIQYVIDEKVYQLYRTKLDWIPQDHFVCVHMVHNAPGLCPKLGSNH